MIDYFKKRIRNYFGFSKAETNGFFLILLVMLIAILAPFVYKSLQRSGPPPKFSSQEGLDSLIAHWEAQKPLKNNEYEDSLFLFNPNKATPTELKSLGLTPFVVNNIVKYREKGGTFKRPEELRKIYGLNDSVYLLVKPFVDLPSQPNEIIPSVVAEGMESKPKVVSAPRIFNINQADTNDLKNIRGVGSVLSRRVIKYRNILGGFYSKEQLKEVYNLDPEVVEELVRYTEINTENCCLKLHLNRLGYQDLWRHPYLDAAQAKAIVAFRQQHGDFQNVEELKEVHLIDQETFTKIFPYLDL